MAESEDRVWLEVPYAEKDEAKSLGARWDPQFRSWYVPPEDFSDLQRWARLPEVLPGEDRSFGSGLFVDLIPDSCWFTNVRSCVTAADWERLRRMVYRRAGERCEVCGSQRDPDQEVWLEAHERWDYDTNRSTQRLRRLVCLCSRCHESTHLGHARVTGHFERALAHLARVNHWDSRTLQDHVQRAFAEWEARNQINWHLDLTMIVSAGIHVRMPTGANQNDHRVGATVASPNAGADDPVPGWYVDPAGRHQLRWWSGDGWTDAVASFGTRYSDPIDAPAR